MNFSDGGPIAVGFDGASPTQILPNVQSLHYYKLCNGFVPEARCTPTSFPDPASLAHFQGSDPASRSGGPKSAPEVDLVVVLAAEFFRTPPPPLQLSAPIRLGSDQYQSPHAARRRATSNPLGSRRSAAPHQASVTSARGRRRHRPRRPPASACRPPPRA